MYVLEVDLDRPWQGLHFVAKDVARLEPRRDDLAATIRPLQFSATPSVAPGTERSRRGVHSRRRAVRRLPGTCPTETCIPGPCGATLYAIVRQPAVELRLYMQTRWLESQPKIDLCTTFPAAAEVRVLRDQQWRPVMAATEVRN